MIATAVALYVSMGTPSQEARDGLSEILAAVEQPFRYEGSPLDRARAIETYDRLFHSLSLRYSRGSSFGHESDPLRRELKEIAEDLKRRPETYAEIGDTYFKDVGVPGSASPQSPNIKGIHEDGRYRLPFEYYLLRPPVVWPPRAWYRALEAITGIKLPASAPVLAEAFRVRSLSPGFSGASGSDGMQIVGALLEMPSTRALEGLSRCLEYSAPFEAFLRKNDPLEEHGWEPVRQMHERIWKSADNTAAVWKRLLTGLQPEDVENPRVRWLLLKLRSSTL